MARIDDAKPMFVREKTVNGYTYLYLVENVRENGRTKQRIIRNLGRKEAVLASGALDRLVASIGRFAERSLVLRAIEEGDTRFEVRRIGAPLLFGRLWGETGCRAVVSHLLAGRGFGFDVERAVFVAVLHRLMVSGSDRSCAHWMADYAIPGAEGLTLHRFYRAMAWLGEEIEPGDLAPRCVKDLIEEALFERRRDLFSDLGVVFMDTTSLSFEGAGGETLGAHGYSKDHRPDLKQMILAIVIDGEGRPVCTEMLPGNTADTTVLLPIVDRLRARFEIGRVCVVADRGMISAATIEALEERGLEYILGARERGDRRVRAIVLENEKPFTPLSIERARGETQLFVKEVTVGGARHIVCRNEAQAEKDRADRHNHRRRARASAEEGRQGADRQCGLPALPAPLGPRRRLRDRSRQAGRGSPLRRHLRAADQRPRHPAQRRAALPRPARGRDPCFRTAKATFDTRPIFHSSDAAIRGHVFCSFLALVLAKELQDRCGKAGFRPEWDRLLRDLDRLQTGVIEKDNTRIAVRTPVTGDVGPAFRAVGVALPPNIAETQAL